MFEKHREIFQVLQLQKHVTPQAHDVKMMSYGRRCDVITSHRRQYDVISTLCVCWEGSLTEQ